MQLIRGIHNLRSHHYGCVLTIGNFDGVHRGHQVILRQLTSMAQRLQLPSVVMLFEPQPQEYFAAVPGPARLTSLREKFRYLCAMGVDRLLCIAFNKNFANFAAEHFIDQLLIKQLGIQALIMGNDFHFGAGRCGDFFTLQKAGQQHDFTVTSVPTLIKDGLRISSTSIRQALEVDNLALSEKLMGHPYKMCGRVAQGNQLARCLGFPTANILLKRRIAALRGVYIVTVEGIAAQALPGVANIGTRPTIDGSRQQLEVHLLDFQQQLYGQHLQIYFHHKLRQEQHFASLTALSQQVAQDIQHARHYFAASLGNQSRK